MTALHAALVAALDKREALWTQFRAMVSDEARRLNLAAVAADRRVLARHAPDDWDAPKGPYCKHCGDTWALWPCDDIRDLAARYDVEVTR